MPLVDFWKYQGLGNDFVVIETDALPAPAEAVRLCDRRRGIGGDGVLSVLPPRAGGAARMHIFNSDGSVAEMCGNGLRCVVRHLAERPRKIEQEGELALVVETDAGPKRCIAHVQADGRATEVSVEMGPARYEGEQEFRVAGEILRAHRVSMGNPHAVFFGESSRERALRIGPLVEAAVAGGVNAGFAAPRVSGIDLVVWERGAGLTEACGTGACAAAVAAVTAGLAGAGSPIEVRLPGGRLRVTVAPDRVGVLMRGPAERVFQGRVEL